MTPASTSGPAASRLALILPAAGDSTRMGGEVRKPLIELLGEPVLCHTLRRFQGLIGLEQIIIVAHPGDVPTIKTAHWAALRACGATGIIEGGTRRQDSVARGLEALHPGIQIVLIHDAVRPMVPRRAIEESVCAADEHGAAVVAVPVTDTIKRARGESASETVPRADLWAAQTPQVFRTELVRRAYAEAARAGFECTDDAQLVERLGVEVRLVRGSFENFKITTAEHLRVAEALLGRRRTAT